MNLVVSVNLKRELNGIAKEIIEEEDQVSSLHLRTIVTVLKNLLKKEMLLEQDRVNSKVVKQAVNRDKLDSVAVSIIVDHSLADMVLFLTTSIISNCRDLKVIICIRLVVHYGISFNNHFTRTYSCGCKL